MKLPLGFEHWHRGYLLPEAQINTPIPPVVLEARCSFDGFANITNMPSYQTNTPSRSRSLLGPGIPSSSRPQIYRNPTVESVTDYSNHPDDNIDENAGVENEHPSSTRSNTRSDNEVEEAYSERLPPYSHRDTVAQAESSADVIPQQHHLQSTGPCPEILRIRFSGQEHVPPVHRTKSGINHARESHEWRRQASHPRARGFEASHRNYEYILAESLTPQQRHRSAHFNNDPVISEYRDNHGRSAHFNNDLVAAEYSDYGGSRNGTLITSRGSFRIVSTRTSSGHPAPMESMLDGYGDLLQRYQ